MNNSPAGTLSPPSWRLREATADDFAACAAIVCDWMAGTRWQGDAA